VISNWATQPEAAKEIFRKTEAEIELFIKKLRFAGIEVHRLQDEVIIDLRENQLDLYAAIVSDSVGSASCEPGCDESGASSGTTDSGRPKR